eukprot:CAMPEP_0115328646 /NCGR_PEP_ID=MMETSP0270-20121206/84793_1 /TAXON_ID=71861 /ORGANISM="Scrippsiella trochoidea, Strain CCMP3099" /LENGTH=389 /DNA_ID=CAMNT_0002749185 /DNA_START=46 /DNA_END=1211 /DNA_ORIENTATION=-
MSSTSIGPTCASTQAGGEQSKRKLAASAVEQERPPLRGVVFDMDGTLTVPNLDFQELYRRAGVPKGEDILSAKWRADANACAIVEDFEEEGRRTLCLMPGAAELGAWLSAHGIPTALVTRNSARTLEHFFAHIWPASVPAFMPAISRDDPWASKPDPASLVHIAKQWGVPAGDSLLMVGDSPSNDVVYGKAAGVRTALLDTGRRHSEGGSTADADFVVENLAWLAALAWRDFDISSPLTDPALHAKREAPTPIGEAAVAAAAGNASALEAMGLEALSVVDANGQTPLIWAADVGSLPAVKVLLKAGVNIDAKGYLGATAVCRAARRGHTAVLSTLLDHGADPQIPNDKLQFPLHFAAFKLKPEAVQVLLEKGASPLVLDRKGRTPAEDT